MRVGDHSDPGEQCQRIGVVVLRRCSDWRTFPRSETVMPEAIAISDGGANGGGFASAPVGPEPIRTDSRLAETSATARSTTTCRGPTAATPSKRGVDIPVRQVHQHARSRRMRFLGVYTLGRPGGFRQRKTELSGTKLGSSFAQTYPVYGAMHFRVSLGRFLCVRRLGRQQEPQTDVRNALEEEFEPQLRRELLRSDERAVQFVELSGRRERSV